MVTIKVGSRDTVLGTLEFDAATSSRLTNARPSGDRRPASRHNVWMTRRLVIALRRLCEVGSSQQEDAMADQAMSAENMRAMLSENLEKLRKASTEYFQMLEKGLTSSQLPIADHAKQVTDLMQRNVAATLDLCDKLIKANDAQDAMKIQSEFFQDQMRALTDQGKSIGEAAMKAMTGAFSPKR
jgi:phasin